MSWRSNGRTRTKTYFYGTYREMYDNLIEICHVFTNSTLRVTNNRTASALQWSLLLFRDITVLKINNLIKGRDEPDIQLAGYHIRQAGYPVEYALRSSWTEAKRVRILENPNAQLLIMYDTKLEV